MAFLYVKTSIYTIQEPFKIRYKYCVTFLVQKQLSCIKMDVRLDIFMFNILKPILSQILKRCLHETRNEILFRHEKNSVYISFHCGRNDMKLTFVLTFWSTIFVFMKYTHAQMFSSGWFHFGVMFSIYHPKWNFLSVKMTTMKWVSLAISFILGYFT